MRVPPWAPLNPGPSKPPNCSAGTKQEVTPDEPTPALEAIRVWPLAWLLAVSPWTIEREIARGHLKTVRTRRYVTDMFTGISRRRTEILISTCALREYLVARGCHEPLPSGLDAFPTPRLAMSLLEITQEAGVSLRTLYRDIRAGKLRPTRIARRVVIPIGEAKRYLEAKRPYRKF